MVRQYIARSVAFGCQGWVIVFFALHPSPPTHLDFSPVLHFLMPFHLLSTDQFLTLLLATRQVSPCAWLQRGTAFPFHIPPCPSDTSPISHRTSPSSLEHPSTMLSPCTPRGSRYLRSHTPNAKRPTSNQRQPPFILLTPDLGPQVRPRIVASVFLGFKRRPDWTHCHFATVCSGRCISAGDQPCAAAAVVCCC
jgi:hypothetical protein